MKPKASIPTEVGAYDAKTRLPELLRQVEAGARFRITHRGRPIAELIPISDRAASDVSASIRSFLALAHAHPVREYIPLKEWIEEGRD